MVDDNKQHNYGNTPLDKDSLAGNISWDTLEALKNCSDEENSIDEAYDINTDVLDKEIERFEVLYSDIVNNRSAQEDNQIRFETLLSDIKETRNEYIKAFNHIKDIEKEKKIEQEALLESINEQRRIKDNMNLAFITLDKTLRAIRNTKESINKQLKEIMEGWKNLVEKESKIAEMMLKLASTDSKSENEGNLRETAAILMEREKALAERETQIKLREAEIIEYCENIQECLEYFRNMRESM